MNLESLSGLLALGAAFAAPAKIGTDLIRKQLPTMPSSAVLASAFVIAQVLVFLTALATDAPFTASAVAGYVLAGLGAFVGAVGATQAQAASAVAVAAVSPDPPLTVKSGDVPETWPVLHGVGGHTAFTALVPASGHEVLDSAEAQHLDGTPINEDETVFCDRCHEPLLSVWPVRGEWVAMDTPEVSL